MVFLKVNTHNTSLCQVKQKFSSFQVLGIRMYNISHHNSKRAVVAAFSQWILYLVIGAIAIIFIIKGGAIDQYKNKATFFMTKEIPVSQRPVVTICPKLNSIYKYGMDFNISIGSIVATLGRNSVKCSDFHNEYDSDDYQPTYDDCSYEDDLDVYETSFNLESVQRLWPMMTCYQVVYDSNTIYGGKTFQLVLVFGKTIPFKDLPDKIWVYLTSHNNSYGVMYNTWIDGNELYFQFPKVKQ